MANPRRDDAEIRAFLEQLPTVHERGQRPAHDGGLGRGLGMAMVEELDRLDAPSIIETGAGNTSLLYLMAGCSAVTSIAPDAKLGTRIRREAEERGLDTGDFTYVNDRSERALPRLALQSDQRFDAALIDGNHGWPSVFVDFCYLNMMLREGGVLFIDDVQIYACGQLVDLLWDQPEYEYVRTDGKMVTYRKTTSEPFLPDWRGEPFIERNTEGWRVRVRRKLSRLGRW